MKKVSAVMPVLIASVVFSFVAIFFLMAQEDQPARRSLGEGGTTDQVATATEVEGQTASAIITQTP